MRHILDEINFLEESSSGIEFSDLMKNREKQRAWLRSFEVIGEATKNLSKEFKEKYPDVEWRKEIPAIKLKVEVMLNEFELPD